MQPKEKKKKKRGLLFFSFSFFLFICFLFIFNLFFFDSFQKSQERERETIDGQAGKLSGQPKKVSNDPTGDHYRSLLEPTRNGSSPSKKEKREERKKSCRALRPFPK
jgi:cytoskeletal protein RodZ